MPRDLDALNDEQADPGQIPTATQVGRQSKRVRTAETLSSVANLPEITESTVGDREVGLVGLALRNIIETPNLQHAAIGAVMTTVLEGACMPGGSIFRMFSIMETRSECRRRNQTRLSRESNLEVMPNLAGDTPPNFSLTSHSFWVMPAQMADSLVNFYDLPRLTRASLDRKRQELAAYCGIPAPTHT